MIYRECYEEGRQVLTSAGIEEAALDARLLLEHICHTGRHDLLVHGDRNVEEEAVSQYRQLIARRAAHIPLQHLTGYQDFMGLTFQVNEKVLVPRQDTECLVEEVLKELHDGMRILDLCTGSGCILISLLYYSNECMGVGADISKEALAVALENAGLLDRKEGTKADWICSDLSEAVEGKFDIIVSNPPYIRSDVIPTLMPEVKEHEPLLALDGMEDGLYFYRRIVEESVKHLYSGGWLFFEIGYDQAAEVSGMMRAAGFADVTVVQDYAGLDRVVFGSYTG